jgi:hypothetical protein
MIEDATGYRNKDQVLFDLAKAFPFSPEALEANRQGRLSKDQFKKYISRCWRPAAIAAVCALAPLLFWTGLTASKQQVSFDEALGIFFSSLVHIGQMTAAHGKFGAFVTLASTLGLLGFAAYTASRIPLALYFDLLERKVISKEGRLVTREENILRGNGRYPIERYYFGMKSHYYAVNQASIQAIEDGSVYRIYLLPRSDVLVSLEPMLTGVEAARIAS